MLYRDLKNAGYSVFHDHNSLGNGDFVNSIQEAIMECKDVIVILSQEALGSRIWNDDDVMRYEIEVALSNKKKIVGIMLPGFDDFPDSLPESISEISRFNCLSSKMEYYDAMLERLISGRFLSAVPRKLHGNADTIAKPGNKAAALKNFTQMSSTEKRSYMRFLMDLGHEFNSSPECMRLYQYLDTFVRNCGIRDTPPYSGKIPTDYATYLSFFETMYLILITDTLDMALVDEMYRFRFFAACNNPEMQKSELLPLGYQYPNVLELYDIWIEYIRILHEKEGRERNFMDDIPMYEYDLRKRYALYTFAMNPSVQRNITFINRYAERKDLVIKPLNMEYLDRVSEFQKHVVSKIENNDLDNIFEPLTEQEIRDALESNCFALLDGERIAAVFSVIPRPKKEYNLLLDLDSVGNVPVDEIMIVDCILVDPEYRGFHIQRAFLSFAEFLSRRMEIKYLCAVVSPKNYFSISNFLKAGYQNVAIKPKYHSVRNYFLKKLSENV